jgi:hypothetical protein
MGIPGTLLILRSAPTTQESFAFTDPPGRLAERISNVWVVPIFNDAVTRRLNEVTLLLALPSPLDS